MKQELHRGSLDFLLFVSAMKSASASDESRLKRTEVLRQWSAVII